MSHVKDTGNLHMFGRVLRVVAIVSIGLVAEAVVAAPLEAYARLPLYENVAISPDGSRAAFVTTIGNEREIIVQSLSSNTGIVRLKAGPQMLRDLSWAGDEQLLVTVSQPLEFLGGSQAENFGLQNFDLRRKAVFDPMSWAEESWNALSREPIARSVNGKPFVFVQSIARPRIGERFFIPALYRVNLKDQATLLVDAAPVSDPKKSYGWTVDTQGDVILQSVYDEETKRWILSAKRNGKWQDIYSEGALVETPSIVGLAPEDNTILVKKLVNGDWTLLRLSLLDGKFGEAIPEKCCGSRYLTDPKSNRVIGTLWLDAMHHYEFFNKRLQESWNQVVQSFPGEELTLESWSNDFKKVVVKVFGKQTGAAYVLIDLDAKQMSRVGNFYAGIEAADIATVRPINYKAADGLQINAYVTLPSGREAKNLPLVVMPHGGPVTRETFKFDWFAQALASKGYLVLQPNFRGSWGFGRKFEEAGYGEWGRKMQTDLSDGVRTLVKLGIVDAARVCIVGASYGGYAALAGATMEPDVYRCAVSVAGLSDMKEVIDEYVRPQISKENRSLRFYYRFLGVDNIKHPVVAERSPVKHADKVKAPILLIHGDNDAVVPFEQSQIMANALKKAGKPYEFVKLKSEDHWLSKAETRLQMLQAVVKFLETHNPP